MPKPNDRKIKDVYNKIAEGFYNLRQQPITLELKKLAEKWKPGLILDVGCGIGNSTLPFAKKSFECIGTDTSQKQIKFAKKYFEKHKTEGSFYVSDIQGLPFESGKFDYVVSAAALHHLDSEEKRLESLFEMKRILKKKGKVFISVWNKPKKEDILYLDKTIKKVLQDMYIPWNHKEKIYLRYYHFFKKDELKNLFEKSGFRKIQVFEDERGKNICVLAFK